jgi:membrane protein DedA with SNARE-associated domain
MLTIKHITDFALFHDELAYALIILGVIIEGEIVVILAGIFVHLGALNIFIVTSSVLIGAFIRSVIGYKLGLYLEKKHSHQSTVRWSENRINYFLPNFTKRPFLSIFLSRFLILGMYSFTLIYAGYKKINIRTFIKAEITSFVVWTSVMLSLGYFFSYAALSISRDIRKFIVIILIFFIAFFFLEKIVAFVIELFETQDIKN